MSIEQKIKIIVIGNSLQVANVKTKLFDLDVEYIERVEQTALPTEPQIKDLTNLVVYLNAGHGNFDGTTYHTFKSDGKFYHFLENNIKVFSAYEGETNRIFSNLLKNELEKRGAEVVLTYAPNFDMHNFQRLQIANTHFSQTKKQGKKFIWFSLHSNAASANFEGEGTTASGIEIYTSNGASANSVNFADRFMLNIRPVITKYAVGNRGHKKAQFTELVGTQMPAVLIENLFFDNLREARLLKNLDYQTDFLNACMQNFEWYSKN